jgi:hypothetical protein
MRCTILLTQSLPFPSKSCKIGFEGRNDRTRGQRKIRKKRTVQLGFRASFLSRLLVD